MTTVYVLQALAHHIGTSMRNRRLTEDDVEVETTALGSGHVAVCARPITQAGEVAVAWWRNKYAVLGHFEVVHSIKEAVAESRRQRSNGVFSIAEARRQRVLKEAGRTSSFQGRSDEYRFGPIPRPTDPYLRRFIDDARDPDAGTIEFSRDEK
ncbi:MAG: hypothetical protein WCJ30_03135 [Deltaproteobacteria bacterium]